MLLLHQSVQVLTVLFKPLIIYLLTITEQMQVIDMLVKWSVLLRNLMEHKIEITVVIQILFNYFSSNWASGVNDELNNNLKVNIQLQYNYYASTNGLFIHTETTFLEDLTGKYHLVIFLIRDEIISPQKFNRWHYRH